MVTAFVVMRPRTRGRVFARVRHVQKLALALLWLLRHSLVTVDHPLRHSRAVYANRLLEDGGVLGIREDGGTEVKIEGPAVVGAVRVPCASRSRAAAAGPGECRAAGCGYTGPGTSSDWGRAGGCLQRHSGGAAWTPSISPSFPSRVPRPCAAQAPFPLERCHLQRAVAPFPLERCHLQRAARGRENPR